MLKKPQRPGGFWNFFKGSAKVLFVAEAIAFAVSYGVYYRMNTNRDFRLYINENCPVLLDFYYKFGETLGNSNIRQIDATYWKAEKKQSTKDN